MVIKKLNNLVFNMAIGETTVSVELHIRPSHYLKHLSIGDFKGETTA